MNTGERILVAAVTDPATPPQAFEPQLLDAIERHRLAPLAWSTLTTSGHADAWPEALQVRLRRASGAQALVASLLDSDLRRVLDAAGHAGVRTVLIKGAALAYTHYRLPHLRPRSDSDIVIGEADRDAMAHVLSALGYVRTEAIDGSLITQQSQWTRELAAGLVHAIDVHWRVFNPQLFGDVLSTPELLQHAVPIPALGPHALSPCTSDALLLSCVHRVAHHAGEEDPIWDHDIHLLVSSLNDDDAAMFVRSASAANVRAVCAAGVALAKARFGTRIPAELQSFLARAAESRERTAVFLEPGRRQVDLLASDLGAFRILACAGGITAPASVPVPSLPVEEIRTQKLGMAAAALRPAHRGRHAAMASLSAIVMRVEEDARQDRGQEPVCRYPQSRFENSMDRGACQTRRRTDPQP